MALSDRHGRRRLDRHRAGARSGVAQVGATRRHGRGGCARRRHGGRAQGADRRSAAVNTLRRAETARCGAARPLVSVRPRRDELRRRDRSRCRRAASGRRVVSARRRDRVLPRVRRRPLSVGRRRRRPARLRDR